MERIGHKIKKFNEQLIRVEDNSGKIVKEIICMLIND